jgi:hypothetical protein
LRARLTEMRRATAGRLALEDYAETYEDVTPVRTGRRILTDDFAPVELLRAGRKARQP